MSPNQPTNHKPSEATQTRTCPVCWNDFTVTATQAHKHTYCSSRCRAAAGRRRAHSNTALPDQQPAQAPVLPQPAAHRDCPHCGGPITIVALLTTPEAARPQPITPPDSVIPPRRVRHH